MLYAVSYKESFSTKAEAAAHQRELGRRLLEWSMRREYGVEPSELKLASGPHGKPFFQNHPACFSVSHCRGLVCCALGEWEIGVDAEPVRPFDPRLVRRICTPEELAYLETVSDRGTALTTLWTLKESLMKMTGEGICYGFQNARFPVPLESPMSPAPGITALCLTDIPGYLVSVCGRGEPPNVIQPVEPELLFR